MLEMIITNGAFSMEFSRAILVSVCIVFLVGLWNFLWKWIKVSQIRNIQIPNDQIRQSQIRSRQTKIDRLELIMALILGLLFVLFCYPAYYFRSYTGTTLAVDILKIAAIVVTMYAIRYLQLKPSDVVVMFFALFELYEVVILGSFSNSSLFVVTFMILCVITFRRYGQIKSYSLQVVISFFCGQFVAILFDLFEKMELRKTYYDIASTLELTPLQKALFLLVAATILVTLVCFLILQLKKLLQKYFEKLQEFSREYKEIGYYLLAIPYLIGGMIFSAESLKFVMLWKYQMTNIFLLVMVLFFVVMQIFYLKLLYAVIHLREHMKFSEGQRDNLLIYNRDINKNMQEIREMKHDLKNIFLTMGEYISRSNDSELKAYYYSNIAPYAQNEIKMNDLYVNMQELQNESLKAFLYYKIMQSVDERIVTNFETVLDHSVLPYLIESSEIIRILGIFLDNALEECRELKQESTQESKSWQKTDCKIEVKIKEKDKEVCFQVKNTVRENVKQQGIRIGATSKGLGRGNGLEIVSRLVKKQNDLIWNSYFQEGMFVQSITIIKR